MPFFVCVSVYNVRSYPPILTKFGTVHQDPEWTAVIILNQLPVCVCAVKSHVIVYEK